MVTEIKQDAQSVASRHGGVKSTSTQNDHGKECRVIEYNDGTTVFDYGKNDDGTQNTKIVLGNDHRVLTNKITKDGVASDINGADWSRELGLEISSSESTSSSALPSNGNTQNINFQDKLKEYNSLARSGNNEELKASEQELQNLGFKPKLTWGGESRLVFNPSEEALKNNPDMAHLQELKTELSQLKRSSSEESKARAAEIQGELANKGLSLEINWLGNYELVAK